MDIGTKNNMNKNVHSSAAGNSANWKQPHCLTTTEQISKVCSSPALWEIWTRGVAATCGTTLADVLSETAHHVCSTAKRSWILRKSTNNSRIHKSTMTQGAAPDDQASELLQVRPGQPAIEAGQPVNPQKEGGGSPRSKNQAFFSKSLLLLSL